MISSVFIDRPRLAIVIAIVITLAGVLSLRSIAVAQFPNIVPPQVQVTTNYPGASAEVVETKRRPADRSASDRRGPHDLYVVDQRK